MIKKREAKFSSITKVKAIFQNNSMQKVDVEIIIAFNSETQQFWGQLYSYVISNHQVPEQFQTY